MSKFCGMPEKMAGETPAETAVIAKWAAERRRQQEALGDEERAVIREAFPWTDGNRTDMILIYQIGAEPEKWELAQQIVKRFRLESAEIDWQIDRELRAELAAAVLPVAA